MGQYRKKEKPTDYLKEEHDLILDMLSILEKICDKIDNENDEIDQNKQLVEQFEQIEQERIGHGKHEEFYQKLQELKDIYCE